MKLSRLLVVAWMPVSLHGQDGPSVAAQAYRELFNLVGRQESHFRRFGRFATDASASRESIRLIILDVAQDGWSAIAFRPRHPEVRCAVASGSLTAPFQQVRTEGPYCVTAENALVAPPVLPDDSGLVYWSGDARLTRRPRAVQCPPLRVPEAPQTNDTVYLEYVVSPAGSAEPADVRVESSGSLVWSFAALERLHGCRFMPAQVDNRPVRARIREIVALAPRLAALPEHSPSGRPHGGEWAGPSGARLSAMRAGLNDVYESGPAGPPVSALGPTAHAVILRNDATGWEVLALHDSLGAARCVLAGGAGPWVVPWADTSTVRCRTSDGVDVPAAGYGMEGTTVDQPPERARCNTNVQLRDDPTRFASATLEFVVGLNGRVEPRSVIVVESTGLRDAAAAVQLMTGCVYRPGRIAGRPVRVLVRQPVNFNYPR